MAAALIMGDVDVVRLDRKPRECAKYTARDVSSFFESKAIFHICMALGAVNEE